MLLGSFMLVGRRACEEEEEEKEGKEEGLLAIPMPSFSHFGLLENIICMAIFISYLRRQRNERHR